MSKLHILALFTVVVAAAFSARAFLLTPVPEPTVFLLALLGAAALCALRGSRKLAHQQSTRCARRSVAITLLVSAYFAMPLYARAASLQPGDIVTTFNTPPNAGGGLLLVDPTTGNRQIITDNGHGTGPLFQYALDVSLMSDGGLLVIDQSNTLIRVDPTTGNRSAISNNFGVGTGAPFVIPSRASQDGNRILVLNNLTGYGPGEIMSVDITNGDRTIVSGGGVGSGVELALPLGFTVVGTNLFTTGYNNAGLVQVDLTTGNRTLIALPNFDHTFDVIHNSDGNLLVTNLSSNVQPNVSLVNLSTQTVSVISDVDHGTGLPFYGPVGLAMATGGTIYVGDVNRDAIFKVDPLTGDRSVLSDATHGTGQAISSPYGLLVIPGVPEPSTLILALLGGLALLAYRRPMA